MRKFIYKEQYARPEATRISDGVIMRVRDVYEVDPELMGTHFKQQNMPLWDTEKPSSPAKMTSSTKDPASLPIASVPSIRRTAPNTRRRSCPGDRQTPIERGPIGYGFG